MVAQQLDHRVEVVTGEGDLVALLVELVLPGPVRGCTPPSLGPVLKMSQPGDVSMKFHPMTSRKKARVAGGSSL